MKFTRCIRCARCNRFILRAAWTVEGKTPSNFGPKCARLMGFVAAARQASPTLILGRRFRRRRDDGQRDWVQEAGQ